MLLEEWMQVSESSLFSDSGDTMKLIAKETKGYFEMTIVTQFMQVFEQMFFSENEEETVLNPTIADKDLLCIESLEDPIYFTLDDFLQARDLLVGTMDELHLSNLISALMFSIDFRTRGFLTKTFEDANDEIISFIRENIFVWPSVRTHAFFKNSPEIAAEFELKLEDFFESIRAKGETMFSSGRFQSFEKIHQCQQAIAQHMLYSKENIKRAAGKNMKNVLQRIVTKSKTAHFKRRHREKTKQFMSKNRFKMFFDFSYIKMIEASLGSTLAVTCNPRAVEIMQHWASVDPKWFRFQIFCGLSRVKFLDLSNNEFFRSFLRVFRFQIRRIIFSFVFYVIVFMNDRGCETFTETETNILAYAASLCTKMIFIMDFDGVPSFDMLLKSIIAIVSFYSVVMDDAFTTMVDKFLQQMQKNENLKK